MVPRFSPSRACCSSCTCAGPAGCPGTGSRSAGSRSRSSNGGPCCCTRTRGRTARSRRSSPGTCRGSDPQRERARVQARVRVRGSARCRSTPCSWRSAAVPLSCALLSTCTAHSTGPNKSKGAGWPKEQDGPWLVLASFNSPFLFLPMICCLVSYTVLKFQFPPFLCISAKSLLRTLQATCTAPLE